MLQNNQITFLLHLCGCIMALISSTQSTQYPPIVTPNYKANRGCPSGQISRSFCPEVNCQQKHIPLDMCGICRTCPHLEREPCGGPYFMHGVCDPNFICMTASLLPVHSVLAEVMSGVNITGKCRPETCLKDCSTRKNDWVCGSDGVWRYNVCFLHQSKCYQEIGQARIRKAKNPSICGPIPTVTTLPKPTSVSSFTASSVEPTSASFIESSWTSAGNREQTRTLTPSNQPVNNRPLSLNE